MSSRKRTLAREQGQAPPEISICPISSTKTHRRQLASRRTGDPWIRNSTWNILIKTRWSRGRGWDPANLRLPNERAKCETQLRGGLTSSSQETIFSETLIPSLSAGQGRIFFSLFKCANCSATSVTACWARASSRHGTRKWKTIEEKIWKDTFLIFACMLL